MRPPWVTCGPLHPAARPGSVRAPIQNQLCSASTYPMTCGDTWRRCSQGMGILCQQSRSVERESDHPGNQHSRSGHLPEGTTQTTFAATISCGRGTSGRIILHRFPFSPEVYTPRCLLAAIDYNRHKDSPVAKRKSDGQEKYWLGRAEDGETVLTEFSWTEDTTTHPTTHTLTMLQSCNKDDIDIEPVGPSCTTNFPLADPLGNAEEVLARRARDAGGSRVT
ncbi:hypothetical protein Bbelb_352640 [Branchiostoma belcheri]|nr:hypothetical protein Bbelb_352640 [Branchiostoma belcheri]